MNNLNLLNPEHLENILSLGLQVNYQDKLSIQFNETDWEVKYEYFNPHANPKSLKEKKIFSNMVEAIKFFIEEFNTINGDLVSVSGGSPYSGNHKKVKMSIRDLLTKNIAYLKDIKEINSDPNHKDKFWDVYRNVKRIQKRLELSEYNIKELPPIQLIYNAIIDGAHRLCALALIAETNPSILDIELDVEIYL